MILFHSDALNCALGLCDFVKEFEQIPAKLLSEIYLLKCLKRPELTSIVKPTPTVI